MSNHKTPLSINIEVLKNGYVLKLEKLDEEGKVVSESFVSMNKKFIKDIVNAFITNDLYVLEQNRKKEEKHV